MAKAETTTRKLTTRDMLAIFGVTHMTLLYWRNPPEGVEHRKTPLPFIQKGRLISFDAKRIKAWGTKNGMEMKYDPEEVAKGPEMKPGKRKPAAKRLTAKKAGRMMRGIDAEAKRAIAKKAAKKRPTIASLKGKVPVPGRIGARSEKANKSEDRPAAQSDKIVTLQPRRRFK